MATPSANGGAIPAMTTQTAVGAADGGGVLGIFWDIENCAVPHGKSASAVADRIRALPVCEGRAEMDFMVVCDVTKESTEVVDDLNAAQVQVVHVAAGRKKNASDEKLRQAMRKFVDTHRGVNRRRADVAIVLISGDQDFLPDLSDFRRRHGVRVVLLHNRLAPEALRRCADEAKDFHDEVCRDVASKSSAAQAPMQYTELLVSNLPSGREMGGSIPVDRKLEELVKAYHGKVRHLNEGERTAVVKFESGEKASRALRSLNGGSLGGRPLAVDFNRRPNFVAAAARQVLSYQEQQLADTNRKRVEDIANNGAVPKRRPVAAVWPQNAAQIPVAGQEEQNVAATRVRIPSGGASAFSVVRPRSEVEVRPSGDHGRLDTPVVSIRPERGPDGVSHIPAAAEVRVTRNFRMASRRVQQLGAGGDAGNNSSSEDAEQQQQQQQQQQQRRVRAATPRRRKKSRNKSGRNRSRPSSCDSVPGELSRLALRDRELRDEQLVAVPARKFPMVVDDVVINDGDDGGELNKHFDVILRAQMVPFYSMKVEKVGDEKFVVRFDVGSLLQGQQLVRELDNVPYGKGSLRVAFVNEKDSLHARACTLLQREGAEVNPMHWDFFYRLFDKFYGEAVSVADVNDCEQIVIETPVFGSELQLRLLPEDDSLDLSYNNNNDNNNSDSDDADTAVSRTQTFYDSCSSTPSNAGGSRGVAVTPATSSTNRSSRERRRRRSGLSSAPLPPGICPVHDATREDCGADYILPCVQTTMSNLRSRLNVALAAHPRGIPRKSLLHCLNATTDRMDQLVRVCNRDSGVGVPLEQLLDALDATDVCERGLVDADEVDPEEVVRRKVKPPNSPAKPDTKKKHPAQASLERHLISVLEHTRGHRAPLRGAPFRETFFALADVQVDAACAGLGGLAVALREAKDTFRVIGRGSKAELVLSPRQLLTSFGLALRRVLSSLDKPQRSVATSDAAAFSLLHQRHLGCVFNPTDYGACYLADLLLAVAAARQTTFRLQDDRVYLCESLETFVSNSSSLLESADGRALTVDGFDRAYVARFGHYSAPALGYARLVGLFSDFSKEFEVIDSPETKQLLGRSSASGPLLGLSKKRRLRLFQDDLRKILHVVPERAVRLDRLCDAFFAECRCDLTATLALLGIPDVRDAIRMFEGNSKIQMWNDHVIYSTPEFWSHFEKRALALLHRRPPHHTMPVKRVFLPVFKKIFGSTSFMDLQHLKSALCQGRANLVEARTFRAASPRQPGAAVPAGDSSELAFTLSPLGLSLLRLADVLASAPAREMAEPELIKAHYTVYGFGVDYRGCDCVADLARAHPDLFYVSLPPGAANRIGLAEGGEYLTGSLGDVDAAAVGAAVRAVAEEARAEQEKTRSPPVGTTQYFPGTPDKLEKKKTQRRSRLAPKFALDP